MCTQQTVCPAHHRKYDSWIFITESVQTGVMWHNSRTCKLFTQIWQNVPEAEVFPLYETYNLSDLAPLLRSEKKKKRVSINESRTDSFFSYQIQTWQSWQPGKTPQSTSSWKHCQVWNKSKQIKTNSHYSRSWMRGREFGSKKENEKHISTLHLSCFFWGSKKPFTKENMPDFFCCACY